MKPYFYFKSILSTDHLTVEVLPSIVRAAKDITKVEIEGRDGFVTQDLGSYKSTIKNVECRVRNLDDLDFICGWLTGSGEAIFSNEPDKIYRVTIANQIDFSKVVKKFKKFIIIFDCQPHKYSLNNSTITLTTPGTLYNPGSVGSDPVIKVYGTGDGLLNIGEQQIELLAIDEYVTIDCEMMDCYKGIDLKNNNMRGDFPQLLPGVNDVYWLGSISQIQITPNWRWL